ncbi:MAG TPA: GNAT family N-acetyltransferase [Solirubrobacterales bacterium]|nr:GNAT family N-acetyltransferase [Solirubrobacterales bacterium]
MDERGRAAHLNLVESSRRLFELDSGAAVEAGEGCLLGAGSASHPVISNAAFRADDRLDPDELIERARGFFGARGRSFAVWARAGIEEDRDLVAALEGGGARKVFAMPEMVLDRRPGPCPPPDDVELRRVTSPEDAEAYWQVAADAYATNGFPQEVFAFYDRHDGLWADGVATFLALLDGRPASIAMTIVNHGVAGIYWVGTRQDARGRGLGPVLTTAAVEAGFEMGGETIALQASPLGRPIYERMGFEAIYDYELYLCPGLEKRS